MAQEKAISLPQIQEGDWIAHCGHWSVGGIMHTTFVGSGFEIPGQPQYGVVHWLSTCSHCVLAAAGDYKKFPLRSVTRYDSGSMRLEL